MLNRQNGNYLKTVGNRLKKPGGCGTKSVYGLFAPFPLDADLSDVFDSIALIILKRSVEELKFN